MQNERRKLSRSLLIGLASTGLVLNIACSRGVEQVTTVEYYRPAYRQSPPEPVYGRLTWTHLPQPIQPKARETSPLLMPTLSFELPKSHLNEAIEALAQTIGYGWSVPNSTAARPIAIKMIGSVEDILHELAKQAHVQIALDNENRLVSVIDGSKNNIPSPKLPGVVR